MENKLQPCPVMEKSMHRYTIYIWWKYKKELTIHASNLFLMWFLSGVLSCLRIVPRGSCFVHSMAKLLGSLTDSLALKWENQFCFENLLLFWYHVHYPAYITERAISDLRFSSIFSIFVKSVLFRNKGRGKSLRLPRPCPSRILSIILAKKWGIVGLFTICSFWENWALI